MKRRKESFIKREPPDDWSPHLRHVYYKRKKLYEVYGFKAITLFSKGNP
jgi:hypothetical protein